MLQIIGLHLQMQCPQASLTNNTDVLAMDGLALHISPLAVLAAINAVLIHMTPTQRHRQHIRPLLAASLNLSFRMHVSNAGIASEIQ